MNLTLKPVTECPAFSKYHNDIWNAELTLLQQREGESCDERIPAGSYDFKLPTVFGEEIAELCVDRVVKIGEHTNIFAWLITNENTGMIALEVLS